MDVAVIGAGAAGLMAAIQAARGAAEQGRNLSITAFDGARTLGAKILVAGGGRCNVTHFEVHPEDFHGASRKAIGKVLRRFDVEPTVAFFRELGVELKREETGKLFPTTDRARTVLDALVGEAKRLGVELRTSARVERVEVDGGAIEKRFRVGGPWGSTLASRVVLATGGRSLPKSGSDGGGYDLVRALGHSLTPRVTPALVPLLLPDAHPLLDLSGLAAPVTLTVRTASGKVVDRVSGPLLLTHFGISGPAALDVSRIWTHAHFDEKGDETGATLLVNWLPGLSRVLFERELLALGRKSVARHVARALPERLALALCDRAGVHPALEGAYLDRERRTALLQGLFELVLPVTGDRGYTYAEVTAGGVPLSEIELGAMESRVCPGLHLCGEICDVDGRIGGFNFQWAWASGFVAGRGAVRQAVS
jgi:predicted Rossmann fold flavoprotein